MPSGERRVHAFATIDSAFRHTLAGLRSLHQGCWLAFLDHRHLDALASTQYSRWRQYRDDDYNGSGLRDWELSALRTHFPGQGLILVAAAGGGREVMALAGLGYEIDAFDCSVPLVEHCRDLLRRRGIAANVLAAPSSAVPDNLAHYAGLIVGWGGYMHIAGRSRRIAFLQALRRRVDEHAPLLLSFFTRAGSSRHLEWTYRIAHRLRRLRGSRDEVELGDTLDGTFDHLFTEAEIRSELSAGGFSLVEYRDSPYGHAVARAAGPG
jgi:hypothetical protein